MYQHRNYISQKLRNYVIILCLGYVVVLGPLRFALLETVAESCSARAVR